MHSFFLIHGSTELDSLVCWLNSMLMVNLKWIVWLLWDFFYFILFYIPLFPVVVTLSFDGKNSLHV